MIFLALLYAALSLHRIIENLKTDLVATRASVASRGAIDLGTWNRGECKAFLNEAGACQNEFLGGKAEHGCGEGTYPARTSISASGKW